MHYHIEIVMPPTKNIEAAVTKIMEPYCEEEDNEDSFWDWYVIGGRFSGRKLIAKYDSAKLDEFYKWLKEEKITVSGVQAGKQTLQPAEQSIKVDAKWNEMFPHSPPIPCPIFSHSNDQYSSNDSLPNDIELVGDVSPDVHCSRFIVADEAGNVIHMFEHDGWNQETGKFDKTSFDGTIGSGLNQCDPRPPNGWLVVTVDAHC